jgi:hypothetical protein
VLNKGRKGCKKKQQPNHKAMDCKIILAVVHVSGNTPSYRSNLNVLSDPSLSLFRLHDTAIHLRRAFWTRADVDHRVDPVVPINSSPLIIHCFCDLVGRSCSWSIQKLGERTMIKKIWKPKFFYLIITC